MVHSRQRKTMILGKDREENWQKLWGRKDLCIYTEGLRFQNLRMPDNSKGHLVQAEGHKLRSLGMGGKYLYQWAILLACVVFRDKNTWSCLKNNKDAHETLWDMLQPA